MEGMYSMLPKVYTYLLFSPDTWVNIEILTQPHREIVKFLKHV